MADFPYPRTTCGCKDCVQCCKEQPGSLIPGDLERIADKLQLTPEVARIYFVASPGALVMDTTTNRQFRVGTITPRVTRKLGCVFLTPDNKCRIHDVAPAGCAYFDTHMPVEKAHPRSAALVRLQMEPDYQRLRSELPFADSYKPRKY